MPRRGENIYKRKDGRCEARYVKEIAIDGTKKYGSVYAKTYSEAKEKQKLFLVPNTTNKTQSKITIERVMYEWLERNKKHLKITTYQKYSRVISNHIVPELGKLQVSFLTANSIHLFQEKLLTDLSKTTVNDILVILSMGLSFSKEEYGVSIPTVHLLKNNPKEMRVLSVSEQNILVKYLLNQNDIYGFAILFALFTGLRIGELCALTWNDIKDNTITVNKTVQRISKNLGGTEIKIMPPKTESSIRIIPIPSILVEEIKRRKSVGYIIKQANGKFVEPRLLQMKFKKYAKECGIENATFHTLRHTFATRCVEMDFDIKTLSEILGHSNVKTTLNKYVHSTMEQKTKQMNKLQFNIAI